MLRRHLTLWLVLSSGLAYWWQDLGSLVGAAEPVWDPFMAGRYTIAVAIVLTMFCIGALLPPDEVRALRRQWPSVVFGTCVQYVTMPLLAWLAVGMWGLTGDLRIGVLIVGCVPGAMASNMVTLVARGNVSYSVGLTTSATMLSPLIVPVALKLTAGQSISNELLLKVGLELVWTVVLPVLAGYWLCRVSKAAEAWFARWGENAANLAILWIIACVVGRQRSYLGSEGAGDVIATIAAALLAVNLLGYLAGYFAGRAVGMDIRRCRALSIEVGMQNAGVGTQLAIAVLGAASTATIPTAMYTFGCMFTGILLAQAFAGGWLDRTPESALGAAVAADGDDVGNEGGNTESAKVWADPSSRGESA